MLLGGLSLLAELDVAAACGVKVGDELLIVEGLLATGLRVRASLLNFMMGGPPPPAASSMKPIATRLPAWW